VRAYYFDAAANHVVLGMLRSGGITPDEAFGILRGAEHTPLAVHPSDIYCILYREHRELRARFWNPDGTREDLCGNALRCVPLVLANQGEAHERVSVHTGIGPVTALHLGPGVTGVEIPTRNFSLTATDDAQEVLVSVGTPHRIRFVDDLDDPSLTVLGERWARAEIPVAATFVRRDGATLCVRSFERGVVRETGSSGTAAIAACMALAHRSPNEAREYHDVQFPGERRLRIRFESERAMVTLYGSCRLEFVCDLVTEGERVASSG
jgi:diaminopimelate epimerase